MGSMDALALVALALLLFTSAVFSAAEISFLSLGRYRARQLPAGRTGRLLARLLARPAETLGAVLLTITAVNYTAEAIAASWVIARLGYPVWVALVGMAALVILFAEIVPISYAAANSERVAQAAALPAWVAYSVLAPPARALGRVAEGLAHLLGGRPAPEAPVTESEIRAIVDLQAEAGGLEEEERAMIHSIFAFGDKVAREVMVPRTEMVAVRETETAAEAGRLATQHRISRLPVYRESLDDIVGVVHVKDVLPLLASARGDTSVRTVMRPPLWVPETKKLSDLLTDFRAQRRTLAVVVDEYGGTAGLVTLEDLLEEVVGDIYDEYDEVRPSAEPAEGGAALLDGRMSIEEASEALGVELPRGDYDSVAGLLYSRFGVVPRVGQRLELGEVTLAVDELDGYRIARVRASRALGEADGGG